MCTATQNVCKSCSEEERIFELDKAGCPISDRFCIKCLEVVAKQRGSKISWDGVDAEQPPAYFDYVFHLSGVRPPLESDMSSTVSTVSTDESVNDTSYLDKSLRKRGFVSGDELEDRELLEDLNRRRRSHVERLSSSSYTREQLLSDLDVSE